MSRSRLSSRAVSAPPSARSRSASMSSANAADPLGLALGGEPPGEPAQPVDRRLLADPLDDVRVQRTGRAAQRLGDVGRRQAPPGGRQPQPGERGAHRRALGELGADAAVDRDALADERQLHRGEQRVDPGEHGDLRRRGVRRRARRARRRRWPRRRRRRSTVQPAGDRRCAARIILGTRRRLWRSSMSAARDDAAGAAVVDLQRVVAGTGEDVGEVDQPAGIGAVVAVDRLVVVADAEHRAVGPGEQADEQQVGRREVLELVDQQQPAGALGGVARRRRRRAAARWPAGSARRSRARPGGRARRGSAAGRRRSRRPRRRTSPRPRSGRAGRAGRATAPRSRGRPGRRCACAGS